MVAAATTRIIHTDSASASEAGAAETTAPDGVPRGRRLDPYVFSVARKFVMLSEAKPLAVPADAARQHGENPAWRGLKSNCRAASRLAAPADPGKGNERISIVSLEFRSSQERRCRVAVPLKASGLNGKGRRDGVLARVNGRICS